MPMLPHIVAGTTITYVDRLVITSLMGRSLLPDTVLGSFIAILWLPGIMVMLPMLGSD